MYQSDGTLSGARVERLHCLFDSSADNKSTGNRYSVPDTYTVGEVAMAGQSSIRIFAEYAGVGQKGKKRSQSLGAGGTAHGSVLEKSVQEKREGDAGREEGEAGADAGEGEEGGGGGDCLSGWSDADSGQG